MRESFLCYMSNPSCYTKIDTIINFLSDAFLPGTSLDSTKSLLAILAKPKAPWACSISSLSFHADVLVNRAKLQSLSKVAVLFTISQMFLFFPLVYIYTILLFTNILASSCLQLQDKNMPSHLIGKRPISPCEKLTLLKRTEQMQNQVTEVKKKNGGNLTTTHQVSTSPSSFICVVSSVSLTTCLPLQVITHPLLVYCHATLFETYNQLCWKINSIAAALCVSLHKEISVYMLLPSCKHLCPDTGILSCMPQSFQGTATSIVEKGMEGVFCSNSFSILQATLLNHYTHGRSTLPHYQYLHTRLLL